MFLANSSACQVDHLAGSFCKASKASTVMLGKSVRKCLCFKLPKYDVCTYIHVKVEMRNAAVEVHARKPKGKLERKRKRDLLLVFVSSVNELKSFEEEDNLEVVALAPAPALHVAVGQANVHLNDNKGRVEKA